MGKRGATLIEATVALTIFVTILSIAMASFVSIYRTYRHAAVMRDTQQNARTIMEVISKTVRQSRSVTITAPNAINLNTDAGPITIQQSGTTINYNGVSMIQGNLVRVRELRFSQAQGMVRIELAIEDATATPSIFGRDETRLDTTVALEGIN